MLRFLRVGFFAGLSGLCLSACDRTAEPPAVSAILEGFELLEEAGKPFIVEAGEHQLEAVVEKSGSWETFITAPLGDIYLTAEVDTLVLRPTSRFDKGALLDLRKLELVPVD